MSDFHLREKCPLCESRRKSVFKKMNKLQKEYTINRCQDCSFVYVESCNRATEYKTEVQSLHFDLKPKRRHYQIKNLLDFHSANYKKVIEVLEVGAGLGLLGELINSDKRYKYIGFEPDSGLAELHRQKGLNVMGNFFEKECKSADVVILDNVLEHVLEPKILLQRCFDVLNPGGYCIIVVPNFNDIRKYIRAWRERFFWHPQEHINCFTNKTLKTLMRDTGFKELANFPLKTISKHPFHYSRVLFDLLGLHFFGLYKSGKKIK